MKQYVGWILFVIGISIISLSVVVGAFHEMTDIVMPRDELAKECRQGHLMTEGDRERVQLLVDRIFMLNLPKKAEPVGYILGGSIVFAGLVILVITAIKGKKEEEDSA